MKSVSRLACEISFFNFRFSSLLDFSRLVLMKSVSRLACEISFLIRCWWTAFSYANFSLKWVHLNPVRYLMFQVTSCDFDLFFPPTCERLRLAATSLANLLL